MNKARRHSRKRDAILEALRKTKEHPCAEWVYASLKPEYPDLSLGTVYRNIAQFQKDGTVVRVATVNGMERYDADTSNHAHFICSCCGVIEDISFDISVEVVEMAEKAVGAKIRDVMLSFGGMCRECASRHEENATQQDRGGLL